LPVLWREKSAIRFLIAPSWLASHKLGRRPREANLSRDIAAGEGGRGNNPRRHHWLCAGDLDPRGAALQIIGMAGTRPAMTREGVIPGEPFFKPYTASPFDILGQAWS
jgi:hypothetical protein